MARPICPFCCKSVNTRLEYAKPGGRAVPKQYGKGTYHLDCYFKAMGVNVTLDEEVKANDR